MNDINKEQRDSFYDQEQLSQVLMSLEEKENEAMSSAHPLTEEEMNKIAKAWSQVDRDKLFKQ